MEESTFEKLCRHLDEANAENKTLKSLIAQLAEALGKAHALINEALTNEEGMGGCENIEELQKEMLELIQKAKEAGE